MIRDPIGILNQVRSDSKKETMPKKSKTPKSFKAAYEELQQITDEFSQEEIDLETSIPKYKRAVTLSKFLKKRLNKLETEIEEISLDIKEETTQTNNQESDDINF